MPEYTGPLTPLIVNGALLAVPILPAVTAVGFLAAVAGGRAWRGGPTGLWAAGPVGSATAVLAGLWYVAARTGGAVIGVGLPVARLGRVDLGLSFAVDATSGPFAIAAGLLATLALASVVSRAPSPRRRALAVAALNFGAAAALLALLTDNALVFLVGSWCALASTTLGASLAAGAGQAPVAGAGRALGGALIAAGIALGGWSFGGEHPPAGSADHEPRLAPMRTAEDAAKLAPAGARPGQTGTVTMTSMPGARVYLDHASTPWQVSPFVRTLLGAGAHTLRVEASGDAEVALPSFAVPSAGETRVGVVGPSFVFRELDEQLAVEPAPGAGKALVEAARGRRLGGLPALVVAWLLCAAGVALGAGFAPLRPDAALAWFDTSLVLIFGVYLLSRLTPWWSPGQAPITRSVVTWVGAVGALVASWSACVATTTESAWARVIVAYGALGWCAAAVDSPLAAVLFVSSLTAAAGVAAADEAGVLAVAGGRTRRAAPLVAGCVPGGVVFWATGALALAIAPTSVARASALAVAVVAVVVASFAAARAATCVGPGEARAGIAEGRTPPIVVGAATETDDAVATLSARRGHDVALAPSERHDPRVVVRPAVTLVVAVATAFGLVGPEALLWAAHRHSLLAWWLYREPRAATANGSGAPFALAVSSVAAVAALIAMRAAWQAGGVRPGAPTGEHDATLVGHAGGLLKGITRLAAAAVSPRRGDAGRPGRQP